MPEIFKFYIPSVPITIEQLTQRAPNSAGTLYVLKQFYQIVMGELTHNPASQNHDWRIRSTSVAEQIDNFIPYGMFNEVMNATRINRSNGIVTPHRINLDVWDDISTVTRQYFQDPECQRDSLFVQTLFYGGLLKLCNEHYLTPPQFEMPSYYAGDSNNMVQVIRAFSYSFDGLQHVINEMEERAHYLLADREPRPRRNEEPRPRRNEEPRPQPNDEVDLEFEPIPRRDETPRPPRKEELILVPYNYGLSSYDICDIEL